MLSSSGFGWPSFSNSAERLCCCLVCLTLHGLALCLCYSGGLRGVGVMFDPVVYSDLSAVRVLSSLGLVFILTLTLALVPACRAARSGDVHLLGRA